MARNDREELLDRPPATCYVGDRLNCKYFVHDPDDDEVDFYCEHPELGENEEECPLDDSDDDSHGIDMDDDDMGNQDEEDN